MYCALLNANIYFDNPSAREYAIIIVNRYKYRQE